MKKTTIAYRLNLAPHRGGCRQTPLEKQAKFHSNDHGLATVIVFEIESAID